MRLPHFITDRLYAWAWSTMGSRPCDVKIGRDERGQPYMERWFAIPRNKVFNIYMHRYYHDDERTLHSHPWWSLSVCVNGGLREWYRPTCWLANREHALMRREIGVGDVVIRSADMFHRLEISGGRTITIFITGPKIKSWYFACKRGLIDWKDFVSARDTGQIGEGCGEYDHYPSTPKH